MKTAPRHPFQSSAASLRSGSRGFALVESVTAVGLIVFAITGLIGLLAAGLTNFRECLNRSGQAVAIQAVRAEIARTPFGSSSQLTLVLSEEGIPLKRADDPDGFFWITASPRVSGTSNSSSPTDPLGAHSDSMRIWDVNVSRVLRDARPAASYSICQADMGY